MVGWGDGGVNGGMGRGRPMCLPSVWMGGWVYHRDEWGDGSTLGMDGGMGDENSLPLRR